jgi:hypothetical protein
MARAADTEDSVRRLATALCGGLWFGADAGKRREGVQHRVVLLG